MSRILNSRAGVIVIVMSIFLVALGVACGDDDKKTEDQGKTDLLILGSSRAMPHFESLVEWSSDEIAARSNPAIKTRVTDPSELGLTGFELIRALDSGLIDTADVVLGWVSGDAPIFEGVDLPGLYDSWEESNAAHLEWLDKVVKPREAQMGGKVLSTNAVGQLFLYSRKPINSPDDLKGMKIRIFGAALSDYVKGLGAEPVQVAFSELYTALEQGVVDGAITSENSGPGTRLYEVTDYLVDLQLGITTNVWVVSGRAWDLLSPTQQELLLQLGEEYSDRGWKVTRDASRASIDTMKQEGIEVVEFDSPEWTSAFQEAAQVVVQGWLDRAGPDTADVFNDVLSSFAGFEVSR